ncbi:alpha-mannosidase [Deinococcus sp.]|uniref:alpha-mannosidase n=1 Tax=Deinococcus sp. TaxID=47478 RepID=UPI003CC66833
MSGSGSAHLSATQRLRRLDVRVNELSAFENDDEQTLTGGTFRVSGGEEVPIEIGDAWPERAEGAVFRWTVEVPDTWAGRPLRLRLNVSGEALARLDGREIGGLNPYHRELELPAERRGPFTLELEASPHDLFGTPSVDLKLMDAVLLLPNAAVRALHGDLSYTLLGTLALLERGREAAAERLLARTEPLIEALNLPRSPTDAYLSRLSRSARSRAETGGTFDAERFRVWERPQFRAAPLRLDPGTAAHLNGLRARLHAALEEEERLTPSEGQLFLHGHAHLDMAWLWPLRETRRKAVRTFSTVLALMERFPDFYYNQSMPQLYAWLEEDAPELFEQVRVRVREGRWNLVGGMWVEPDGNLPCGESWARQLLYGQRYFQSRFGERARIGWLPDTFGYAGNLPQLFAQAGLDYFCTTKLIWNETSVFPYHLYRWEGLDGTQVTAHLFNNPQHNYNGDVVPGQLIDTWRAFRGVRYHPESLFTFGHGDGGGGPTTEMLERLERFPRFPGLPRLRSGPINDFFAALPSSGLPIWVGEQYFEFHRGTYSTQGRVKRLHRQAEVALVEAEVASTLAYMRAGGPDCRAELEALWKTLLLQQFHDILPGSSIATVCAEAEAALSEVVGSASERRGQALAQLSGEVLQEAATQLAVWNLSLQPRPLVLDVAVDTDTAPALELADGTPLLQEVRDGRLWLSGGAQVPALSRLSLRVVQGAQTPPPSLLSASAEHLENEHLRAELNPDGSVSALWHKSSGRQLLSGAGNALWAHADLPRAWEAWDVDAADLERGERLTALGPPEVRVGPVVAETRYRYECEGAQVEQTYRLRAGAARLDICTRLVWTGRRTLLRATFPVNLRARSARFETAYGVVERPTHTNMPADGAQFEVPALRFAYLNEGGVGLSLLNDGRHGHSVKHGVMSLTLLRSPIYPDPHADEGEHEFTYSLFPHADSSLASTFVQAHDLNAPLLGVWTQGNEAETPSLLSVTHPGVQLSTLKLGEDGSLIVRLAESTGRRGPLGLGGHLAGGWRPVTLLEEDTQGSTDEIGPFAVLTLRREQEGPS